MGALMQGRVPALGGACAASRVKVRVSVRTALLVGGITQRVPSGFIMLSGMVLVCAMRETLMSHELEFRERLDGLRLTRAVSTLMQSLKRHRVRIRPPLAYGHLHVPCTQNQLPGYMLGIIKCCLLQSILACIQAGAPSRLTNQQGRLYDHLFGDLASSLQTSSIQTFIAQ
ncbi:hypothetical protein GY45DRAFT_416391 [Cubamyces sp. BRFM 1775]|nr:hypothetical protein GY45DRAFT_416391 [Cubamyces sp. BRFM 1775]